MREFLTFPFVVKWKRVFNSAALEMGCANNVQYVWYKMKERRLRQEDVFDVAIGGRKTASFRFVDDDVLEKGKKVRTKRRPHQPQPQLVG